MQKEPKCVPRRRRLGTQCVSRRRCHHYTTLHLLYQDSMIRVMVAAPGYTLCIQAPAPAYTLCTHCVCDQVPAPGDTFWLLLHRVLPVCACAPNNNTFLVIQHLFITPPARSISIFLSPPPHKRRGTCTLHRKRHLYLC